MPIFILVDITEKVVESVAQKLSWSIGPSGTYLEALQGWILKFGDHSKKLRINVEFFGNGCQIKTQHSPPVGHLSLAA